MRAVFVVPVAVMVMLLGNRGESASPRETGGGARECLRRNVPTKMLQELSDLTSDLVKSLPSDDIKHVKLLKFGKSIKKSKGIRILEEVVDFYQGVFSKVFVKDESQKKEIEIILSRLGREVQRCSGLDRSTLRPKERKCVKEMNKTFTKLQDKGIRKAVGEFHVVLDWVESYMHKKKSGKRRRRGHRR